MIKFKHRSIHWSDYIESLVKSGLMVERHASMFPYDLALAYPDGLDDTEIQSVYYTKEDYTWHWCEHKWRSHEQIPSIR